MKKKKSIFQCKLKTGPSNKLPQYLKKLSILSGRSSVFFSITAQNLTATRHKKKKQKTLCSGAKPAHYLVFPLDDGLKQALLGAVERKAAGEEDEEDDSASPHVHWFAVRLPLHNLGGHEVRRADSTCGRHTAIS